MAANGSNDNPEFFNYRTHSLVSVVIPAFNRENTIANTINSVKNQTYNDVEVIIVDDGSSDNTAHVVNNLSNNKDIVFIQHESNKGACAARNTGLRHSNGIYVAFLDSDDIWHPNFIRDLVACLDAKDDSYGCAFSSYISIDEIGNKVEVVQNNEGDLSYSMLRHNCGGALSSSIFRASALRQLGGFDPRYPACQDWELYIRLSQKWRFTSTTRTLTYKYDFDKAGRISDSTYAMLCGHLLVYRQHIREVIKKDRLARIKFKKKIGKFFIINKRYRMGSKLLCGSLLGGKIDFGNVILLLIGKSRCPPSVIKSGQKFKKVTRRVTRAWQP